MFAGIDCRDAFLEYFKQAPECRDRSWECRGIALFVWVGVTFLSPVGLWVSGHVGMGVCGGSREGRERGGK